ncbi:hypothetical protein IW262DRAFT_1469635 [Armillaria fumosa]|nr:hypothetical protein IW262DRAFT_1469635 [Armillaria fumosa]
MNSCGALIIRAYGKFQDDAVLMVIGLFSIAFVPAVRSRFLITMTLRPLSAPPSCTYYSRSHQIPLSPPYDMLFVATRR